MGLTRKEGVFVVCKERIVDDVVNALRFAGDCSRVSYDANSQKLPPLSFVAVATV